MEKLKTKIEMQFVIMTGWLYRNRFKTLFVMFLFIGYFGSQITNLTVDSSIEDMLHSSDPSRIEYDKFKEQYGNSEYSILMIESPEIFSSEFLTKLKSMHQDLEESIPYLHKVTSLMNIRCTRGEGDTLLVDELLKDWPEREYDLKKVKKFAENNTFYKNKFLSENGKFTLIVVENRAGIEDGSDKNVSMDGFDDDFEDNDSKNGINQKGNPKQTLSLSPAENKFIKKSLSLVISKYDSPEFPITFTSAGAIVGAFNSETEANIGKFLILTTLVIIIFLALLFRRITGTILPFFVVTPATVSTMGIMSLTGTPISMMTQIIPSFILAVGIADAIHVLAIFYREYQTGKTKEEAICFAMGHSGFAIVMTSITTAASLLSFSFAEIASIAEMGLFASLGVILALLFSIILLPAFIAVVPVRRKPMEKEKKKSAIMDKFLLFFVNISTTYPIKIVAICIILTVVSVHYITDLRFTENIVDNFPDDHHVKLDLNAIDEQFKGTYGVEVLIDTEFENGVYDPEILNRIENLSNKITKMQNKDLYIGNVSSIIDIVKETNQALNGNDEKFYTIPQNKQVVSQVPFMFETSGSDDLEEITDSQFRKTRLRILTKWSDAVAYKTFIGDIEKMFKEEFGDKATISVTGITALLARIIPAAQQSMIKSYIIALCIITILMVILVGDLKLGILSMFPNVFPIVMVMGLIQVCGFTLNLNTLFIGSIALGIVVDDTIHFMYNFKKYYNLTNDSKKAIKETLLGTGRALLITSIVLCANFFTLMTGSLTNMKIFGFFTGIVIIFALLADFILAPALMTLAMKKKSGVEVVNFQQKTYENERSAS